MTAYEPNFCNILNEYAKDRNKKTAEALQAMVERVKAEDGIGYVIELAVLSGIQFGVNHKDEILAS